MRSRPVLVLGAEGQRGLGSGWRPGAATGEEGPLPGAVPAAERRGPGAPGVPDAAAEAGDCSGLVG